MTRPVQVSYGILATMFVLAAWFGLATPLVTILFSYFALERLAVRDNRLLAVLLFTLVVAAVGYASGYFFNQALHAFPKIAAMAIPAIIKFAKEHNLELPFTDLESLKALALDTVMDQMKYFGKSAGILGKHTVLFVIGLVVAVSLFLRPQLDLDRDKRVGENFYSVLCREIEARFRSLYQSFTRVMGAQITISTLNTGITSLFITWMGLPYAGLVIAVTFFCGLLPIVGNLISNTVIVSIAFTVSPRLGVAALVFLVVLHKLEYFLNSKIIGGRIRNPMWLTLLALIVGEKVMGVPGMILAPVVLDYLRTETSRFRAESQPGDGPDVPAWRHAVSD
jgi:predicted PurR-regulated permease PerM